MPISFSSLGGGGGGSIADAVTTLLLSNPSSADLDAYLAESTGRAGLITALNGPHLLAIADNESSLTATMSSDLGAQISINPILTNATTRSALLANDAALNAATSNSTAMAAIANDATAMAAIANDATRMAAIANDAAKMTAIVSSEVALSALFNSSTARVALFNSAVAEQVLRENPAALSYLGSNFGTSASVSGAGNVFLTLTNSNVLIITASTGYTAVNSRSHEARYFVHFDNIVTSNTLSESNYSSANPWLTIAGRMVSGLEILAVTGLTNTANRTATFVVME